MATITESAEEVVLDITKRHAYVGGSAERNGVGRWSIIHDRPPAQSLPAGHSVHRLSRNTHEIDPHFLLQLLKKADENKFSRAIHAGDDPFVSFDVHPDRVVTECNEDGFSTGDIIALCAMSGSTKRPVDRSIGAHIGLSPVFDAAWKIHFQTSSFSFAFENKRGTPGSGTLTPILGGSSEGISGYFTRMTLFLHENSDTGDPTRLQDALSRQVADLQHTCLLFLKNIKEIQVSLYDEAGLLVDCKIHRLESLVGHIATLETASIEPQGAKVESRHYHVTRHLATGLATSNKGGMTGDSASSSESEVVLTFPLTEDSGPVVEPQHVFNFFPAKQYGFTFIIHADFDTNAGEQDVITVSCRNVGLLGAIASTFVKAVLQMCGHSTEGDTRALLPVQSYAAEGFGIAGPPVAYL
ncbi:uncharacterized protein DNG_08899 [Cephalotrichum gorgonifer]|uniref:Uncharacterized protein n=1 Tax=Cephalotrichum gorgonifer TaxID=2041049 RepID=A0AAE8SYS6_9PEZI|nr:uncharacterized protein DNG_08899 [Cephalotrichum gorgonifer]